MNNDIHIPLYALAVIVFLGVCWSIYRETYIATINRDYMKMAQDVIGTLRDLHHTMERVCEHITNNANLSKEQKQDLLGELSKVENRIVEEIRNRTARTNIFNTNAASGQVNQGGFVEGSNR